MVLFDLMEVPSQKGRIAVVTGANSGLGFETALAFAKKDIRVVMACRSLERGVLARARILEQAPAADLEVMELDLSRMGSVRDFTESYLRRYDRLDLLINNAGVMAAPYQETEDGFEIHLAANYLGHFLLTGLLTDTLLRTPRSRVVSLSSNAHYFGNIRLDDLHWKKRQYYSFFAYCQSKLACLVFAFELQRRLEKTGAGTLSLAAHPGATYTEIVKYYPEWIRFLAPVFAPVLTHPPAAAAEPTLYAALGENVSGGQYFGPGGWLQFKGRARIVGSSRKSKDTRMAGRLWDVSEELTGIRFL